MIPTTIGNMIGGGIFVGAIYWYLFLTGEGSVDIDFNIGSLESAMEAGGPMGRKGKREGNVIEGKVVDEKGSGDTLDQGELPHSGGRMTSGIGRELSGEHITGRKGVFDTAKVV